MASLPLLPDCSTANGLARPRPRPRMLIQRSGLLGCELLRHAHKYLVKHGGLPPRRQILTYLQIAQVQHPSLAGGALTGGRCGVAVEHVTASPTCHGHQAALAAASREPAVRGGVPQHVGMEASDAGDLGAMAEREVQRVIAEAPAAITEPQRRGVGEAVLPAKPQ